MAPRQPLRRLPLSNTLNTREMGGYPCAAGMTRWGAFLRSDHPRSLSEEDVALLQRAGVTTVVDLRGERENTNSPNLFAAAGVFEMYNIPLNDRMHATNFEGDLPGSMSGLYISLLDDSQGTIKACFDIFAAAKGAVLFHCAVGKDRTGVLAMLLMDLVGCSEDEIVADYAVSEVYMNEWFDAMVNAAQGYEIPEVALHSLPASMRRALQHLREQYTDAEQYLLGIGITQKQLDKICKKFAGPVKL